MPYVHLENCDRMKLLKKLWQYARCCRQSNCTWDTEQAKQALQINRFAESVCGVPLKVNVFTSHGWCDTRLYDEMYGKYAFIFAVRCM